MACFDTGNATPPSGTAVLLFSVADPSEISVSLVADTAGLIYVGRSPNVTSANGFLVGTIPVQFDCKMGKNTTLYATGNGTAKIHWIFGA